MRAPPLTPGTKVSIRPGDREGVVVDFWRRRDPGKGTVGKGYKYLVELAGGARAYFTTSQLREAEHAK